jgi:hypothetical protein
MLRGDYKRARAALAAAQCKDPTNRYLLNNIHLLGAIARARASSRPSDNEFAGKSGARH